MTPAIEIIGVPLDLGQHRRGVDMGPSAIRAARLQERLRDLGYEVTDAGNVVVPQPETRSVGDSSARYLKEIAAVCRRAAGRVHASLRRNCTPLVLGGDHSLAAGSVAGAARFAAENASSIGLIWLDAHPDANTPETSPSGNIHGMSLAALLGRGPVALCEPTRDLPALRPRNVAVVGVRSVDRGECDLLRALGAHVFTMRDIDERGMSAVMKWAIEAVTEDTFGFHVSLDLDFVDPKEAPGVGTPVRGGATYREAHLALEMVADSGKLRSMDLVEVNPMLDCGNQTAELAVDLALSAFGNRIL